jgi:hypothetical protein
MACRAFIERVDLNLKSNMKILTGEHLKTTSGIPVLHQIWGWIIILRLFLKNVPLFVAEKRGRLIPIFRVFRKDYLFRGGFFMPSRRIGHCTFTLCTFIP